MNARVLVTALLVSAFAAAAPAQAQQWRFCVGVAPAAHETIITDIFASAADSARIERKLEAYVRAHRGKSLVFQCPRGVDERVEALNAQTAALQFNRKMGFAVDSLPAAEISTLSAHGSF
jgi:hypothetical protein